MKQITNKCSKLSSLCGNQNSRGILTMSFTMSIHYSLTATICTIFPELSDQKGYQYIGQITIMITYIMQLWGSIYAQKFISLKKSGLSFYISGLLPIFTFIPALIINQCDDKIGICTYYSIAIISIICFFIQGLGLGAYFLLQNCYLSACINACINKESGYFLNGISFAITGTFLLVGDLYSLPLIDYLTRQNFFIVLCVVQIIVNFFFLLLPNPQEQEETKEQVVDEEILIHSDPIKVMIYYLSKKSVYILVPYFTMTGLVIGFEFGQFYQIITASLPAGLDQVEINQKTLIVFIFLGIGEITSGPIIALIKNRLQISFYLKLYTYLAGFNIIITSINIYLKSYEFCFFIAFCWGTLDNFGLQTCNIIITKIWGNNLSIFGIYLVFQNFGTVIYQFFVIFFQYSLMIYGLIFILFVQILTMVSIHIFVNQFYQNKHDENSDETTQ